MIWERAYKECLKNADKYLEDSIALKESSAGHALALAIIGQEEVGKALLNFLIGVVEELGEAQLAEKWRQQIYSHETKLTLALMSSFMQSLTTVEMKNVMEEMPNLIAKARSSRDPRGVVRRYLLKLYPSAYQQTSSEAPKAIDSAYALQDLKEKGLYVDAPKGGSISAPFGISKTEVEEQIRKLKEGREIVENLITLILKYQARHRLMAAQVWLDVFRQYQASSNIENTDT
jgi:AbiV family abortive infection protein